MNKYFSFTAFFLLVFFASFAQQSLNDYKYVMVSKQYGFLKEVDEYRLNSLSKFLFEKHNFHVLMEGEILPSDYLQNNCLALKADVLKESTLFKTKLSIQLKNCKNEIIYTSIQGTSKAKSFRVAYNEALRIAFKSFDAVTYNYSGNSNMPLLNDSVSTKENKSKQEEIEKLKEELKVLKEDKKAIISKEKPVEVLKPLKANVDAVVKPIDNTKTLYAQTIENGFHLMDKSPKLVYTIFNSGKPDLYIVKGKDAIIYKLKGNWVIAEVLDVNVKITPLNIKF